MKKGLLIFTLIISFILVGFFLVKSYPLPETKKGKPVVRNVDFSFPSPLSYPIKSTQNEPSGLTAKSVFAIDFNTKAIILSFNPDLQLLPASTTKLMTALVSLDYFKLDQVLTVSKPYLLGRIMNLHPEEKITLENLLKGLLIHSGNDAAFVLADNFPEGGQAFVQKMNEKAMTLHLDNTRFQNPAGIDAENQFSTAHDLAILAVEALKNPFIYETVGTYSTLVSDVDSKYHHQLTNVNQLLPKISGIKGVKTGWTTSAGECLIALMERDNQKIITVVMASSDRFGETEKLINWIFENYEWQ